MSCMGNAMKTSYLLILLLLTNSLFAQFGLDKNVLDFKIAANLEELPPNTEFKLAVVLDIHPELHINAHETTEDFLIPTVVTIQPQSCLIVEEISYPDPVKRALFTDETLNVYENRAIIYINLRSTDPIPKDSINITGSLSYQGCDDQTCFQPKTHPLQFSMVTTTDSVSPGIINADLFTDYEDTPTFQVSLTEDEYRAKQIIDRGVYALFFFFFIGLSLNLTPCVYPIIPLTVSYFGGQSARSTGSSFLNALLYLIGIALSFSALGLVSGLAGKQWGFLFSSPWFIMVIVLIILSMAASMFGAFEITVPSWLLTKMGGQRQGLIGALLMGLTVGVVIAPCAAGIIIGLVGLVAKLGLVAKGAVLFFIMGLGLGVPYLILGTFSGLLTKLPQSGIWLIWVRKIFGIILVGVAIYFLLPQFMRAEDKLGFQLGFLTIFAGLYLGFLDQESGYTKGFKWFRAIVGILLITAGVIWTHSALFAVKETKIDWIYYSGQDIEEIVNPEKPIFIDFFADWCAPCKQLDRETFQDDEVAGLSSFFNMIKVDCTTPSKATEALMKRFEVEGFPTLVFINHRGEENKKLREIGFIGPEKFIEHMQAALQH
jgi:thioredoxin:protein disulfide reductase